MANSSEPWQYLIVTAANARQASAYEAQIRLRREAGQLAEVRDVFVVPDPEGRRVGSGGSTIECLMEVLGRESAAPLNDFESAETILRNLRILIVHAGGDSRRLPAYSPCGKIFVPVPGDAHSAFTPALFDLLVPSFLTLPAGMPGAGQIVIAAGDALIRFDPRAVARPLGGITALGSGTSPDEAARHGVFCADADGSVRRYLQKPAIRRQQEAGAIGADGRSVLDIGVMSLDAQTAVRLLRAFWTPEARRVVLAHGIDLYREICAALGSEATFDDYLSTVRASGSKLDTAVLGGLFSELRAIPMKVQVLSHCSFLHFGSTRQLIDSGIELMAAPPGSVLTICTDVQDGGRIDGLDSWVEGCQVRAPLRVHGRNVVVGVDVTEPFELAEGACLDVSAGFDRNDRMACFIRYCGINDTFQHSIARGGTFCGKPLAAWLESAGVRDCDVWSSDTPDSERTLWNARVFPAEQAHGAYCRWSWMYDVENATPAQKRSFLGADRYSSAEIALRVDHEAFHTRRAAIRALWRDAG